MSRCVKVVLFTKLLSKEDYSATVVQGSFSWPGIDGVQSTVVQATCTLRDLEYVITLTGLLCFTLQHIGYITYTTSFWESI